MPKIRKITATMPDGSLVSRSTHRDYAFVVAVRGKPPLWEMLRETYASGAKSNYLWAQKCLANPDIQHSFSDDELARISTLTIEEHQAEQVSRLEARQERDKWEAHRWTSRSDLALKEASRINPEMYEIYIAKVNK